MENGIKIYRNEEFGEIRTLVNEQNGEPLFCAMDVCGVLGYNQTHKAVERHVEEADRTKRPIRYPSGSKLLFFVNESGLYSLILSSKMPKARQFKNWVTSDVLPSIRKYGAYMTDATIEQAIDDPNFFVRLGKTIREDRARLSSAEVECKKQKLLIKRQNGQLLKMGTQIEGLEQQVEGLQKKVSYLDLILATTNTVTVSQIAADYGMSAIKLNRILKEMGIQYKMGDQWLLYAKYKDKGYVGSETVHIELSDGSTLTKMNTKWTQEGRLFLYDILKRVGIQPMLEQKQLDFSNKHSA